jgi:hypothetical protein
MARKGTRSSRLRPAILPRVRAAQIRGLTWRSNIRRQATGRRLRMAQDNTARLRRVKKIRTTPHAVSRE